MVRKLLFLCVAVLLLAACIPTTADPTPTVMPHSAAITLTDGLSRTVSLTAPARRVVSLTPAGTEILFAVGGGAQVAGRDMFSDFPEAAKSVQDIGGSRGTYNQEAIVALHPDLVLAGGINPPELVASLEHLGLTIYFLPNPATLEEMYTNLETVGALIGHGAEAAALVDSLKTRVAAVDEKIIPLSFHPSVYYELDATDATKPYTAGPGTFVDLLITRAGGSNIGSELQSQWAQISLEQMIVANPNIIILGDSAYGATIESVKARPGWDSLDAVKNRQIFPFDDNLVSRPGPRLVDGLEALAKLLHPGVFK